MDLRANEPAQLAPGQRLRVPTGMVVAIPSGHIGLVLSRSGLAFHHGVVCVNQPGLIDSGYRGEIAVPLINLADTPYQVERGDRIAQLVVLAAVAPVCVAAELDDTVRGNGGFGSSGR